MSQAETVQLQRPDAVAAYLRPADLTVIDELAREAGIDRSTMTSRIVSLALQSPADLKRTLGQLARPKRAYMRREARDALKAAQRAAAEAEKASRMADEAERQAEGARAAQEARERALAAMPEPVRTAIAGGQHPLRAVRLHLGLRQCDVAEKARLGLNGGNYVGEIERGVRPFTPRIAGRLAAAMGVEPAWLQVVPDTARN